MVWDGMNSHSHSHSHTITSDSEVYSPISIYLYLPPPDFDYGVCCGYTRLLLGGQKGEFRCLEYILLIRLSNLGSGV